MEDRFDAIIVGGGLSGLAAAYTLAEAGQEVLLIERGDYCGAKNVTGGRMYVNPIKELLPDIWKKAPFERGIAHEEVCLMSEKGSMLLRYSGDESAQEPYQSYSVTRAKFDKYLAKQAERKGASIVVKTRAEDILWDNGKVDGIVANGDELRANVVIACDGVLSFIAEKAGLRKPGEAKHYAVGFKEIIEMDQNLLAARFNLKDDQGVARLYMGDVTQGKFGGGFLYTNKNSISLGIVIGIADLINEEPQIPAPEMLERFKNRPEVAALIAGGETVEYSGHVIPEGGYKHLTPLYGNGMLVCGDAAGFSINSGVTVRGMEYAIASGYYAARAVIQAKNQNDFSVRGLSCYEQLLHDSFVMQDFKTFKEVPEAMDHKRLFTYYPELAINTMQKMYEIPDGPKDRIVPTVKAMLGFKDIWEILTKDAGRMMKL
ncbi:MAG TPA: FAD-dependent oxidoreductase [Syntrophomonas sp.]|nr:FAD-dependent oxidoreductase [Syntrophomonas sp.]